MKTLCVRACVRPHGVCLLYTVRTSCFCLRSRLRWSYKFTHTHLHYRPARVPRGGNFSTLAAVLVKFVLPVYIGVLTLYGSLHCIRCLKNHISRTTSARLLRFIGSLTPPFVCISATSKLYSSQRKGNAL